MQWWAVPGAVLIVAAISVALGARRVRDEAAALRAGLARLGALRASSRALGLEATALRDKVRGTVRPPPPAAP